MYLADRSRDSLSREPLRKIQRFISLMTVSQHWIIRQIRHCVRHCLNMRKMQQLSLLHSVSARSYMQIRSWSWMMERLSEKEPIRNF